MNFVALIGIIKKIGQKENGLYSLKVKVDKNTVDKKTNQWYELIEVKVDEKLFKSRVLGVKDGDIVGIKGRLVSTNNLISLMCERLQVF